MGQGSGAPPQYQPQQQTHVASPFHAMGQGMTRDDMGHNGMPPNSTPQIPGVNQPTGNTGFGGIAWGPNSGNQYTPPTTATGTPSGAYTSGQAGGQALPGTPGATVGAYTQAAQQMGQYSQQATNAQTQANRPNQSTPFASSNWVQGPNGQWTQQVGFSSPMQGAYNTLLGQYQAGPGAFQSAAYDQAKSRLDPMFNQQNEQLQSQLANQGLAPGSAAWSTAMDQFGRTRNDAYSSAFNQSLNNGLAAQQANFSQLQGLQGFLSMPGFNAAGVAQTPNYLGAIMAGNDYNLALDGYNNANAADQAAAGMQILNAGAQFAGNAYGGGYGGYGGPSYSI